MQTQVCLLLVAQWENTPETRRVLQSKPLEVSCFVFNELSESHWKLQDGLTPTALCQGIYAPLQFMIQ